ncbi:DUF5684 domain-containing protein [Subtercola endophyticus]|uniref:DUF5684 domain-containing protein n=1 Tax=Subtercola endophyticus TaxID=2895559 RepID=UPI001E4DC8F6|nr:DUF5684 domain-containing protein [Subtercola endophyticus]UFS59095.1 DUF5684 domain-containing protein [Subtercola endophyticus]
MQSHDAIVLARQVVEAAGGASNPGQTTGQVIGLLLGLLTIVGMWVTFQKAGRHGWAAIIPVYNLYTLIKITGRSGWWLLLFIIPLVNVVVYIVIVLDVAASFGKGVLFGAFGLWLFPFVGFPVLGFGSARYEGTPLF